MKSTGEAGLSRERLYLIDLGLDDWRRALVTCSARRQREDQWSSETAVTTPRNFICPETSEPCVNPHCTRVKCLDAIRAQFDKEQADKEAEKQRESAFEKGLRDEARSPPPAPPPKQGPTLIKKPK